MIGDEGWVFAVGAGRRLDYSVIAAPAFLVQSEEYGVLKDVVRKSQPDTPPRVVHMTTSGGQQLTLAYATHALTAGDITDPRRPATEGTQARDEQNRPLLLIFGVVIRGNWRVTVDPFDVDAARAVALQAYRRFLTDEVGFEVVSSVAFRLRSELDRTPRAETPSSSVKVPAGQRRRPFAWLAVVAGVVLLAVLALGLRGCLSTTTPCPPSTTTTAPSTTTTATDAAATSVTGPACEGER